MENATENKDQGDGTLGKEEKENWRPMREKIDIRVTPVCYRFDL